jgi:nitroreductase
MDLFDAVSARRSVKKFDPAHKLSEAELTKLVEATILSPTSFNIQNWRFVAVADTALRAELRKVAWDQAQVTEASALFILTADLKAWDKQPERYWRNAPEEYRNWLVNAIRQFYQGRDQVQRDEAMRSVGLAGQTLMLAAKAMNYDSCPMIGFDAEAVAKLINLPSDHVIGMMITVGKALEPARARGGQLAINEVLVRDKFAA